MKFEPYMAVHKLLGQLGKEGYDVSYVHSVENGVVYKIEIQYYRKDGLYDPNLTRDSYNRLIIEWKNWIPIKETVERDSKATIKFYMPPSVEVYKIITDLIQMHTDD